MAHTLNTDPHSIQETTKAYHEIGGAWGVKIARKLHERRRRARERNLIAHEDYDSIPTKYKPTARWDHY